MKIESIYAKSLKGQTFKHDLGPVTLFTGRNASGKTARLDAIRLLIHGYIPHLGTQHSTTFMLSSSDHMEVHGIVGGEEIKLSWKKSKDKVKYSADIGEPLGLPKILSDSREYFGISLDKRNAFLSQFVKLDSADLKPSALIAKLKSIKVEENHTENHEKALESIVEMVMKDGSEFQTRVQVDTDYTFQNWIDDQIAGLTLKVSTAKASVDRMKKSVEGLTELNIINPNEKVESVGELEAKKAKLLSEKEKFQKESIEFRNKSEKLKELIKRKNEIQISLQTFARIEGEKVQYQEKEKAIVKELEVSLLDHSEEIIKTEKDKRTSNAQLIDFQARIQTIEKDWREATVRLSVVESEIKNKSEVVKKFESSLEELMNKPECPYCKGNAEGWQEKVKANINDSILKAKLELETVQSRVPDLTKFKVGSEEELKTCREREKEIKSEIERLDSKAKELAKTQSLREQKKAELQGIRNTLESIQKGQESTGKLQQEHDSITFDNADVEKLIAQSQEAFGKAASIGTSIMEIELSIKQAVGSLHETRRKKEAQDQLLYAQAELEVSKLCLECTKEFRSKIIEHSFQPILAIANSIAAPILRSPLVYHEGDIWRQENGAWINHETFSGSEKALTYAAMGIAIASQSPFKFLCIDELGNFYPEDMEKLIRLMVDLVKKGEIDQFVGAVPNNLPPIEGVTVIPC